MGILLNRAKNYLINGAMDYWQRGTSLASIGSGNPSYVADRIKVESGGTAVSVTASRQTDVPLSEKFTYSNRNLIISGTAPMATGQVQRIEASIAKDLANKKATFTFWAKRAGTVTSLFVNLFTPVSGVDDTWGARTYINDTAIGSSTIISVSSSWQKYSITFDVPSSASLGLAVAIWGGSMTVNDGFLTTGWQLEEGVSASNFERAGGNIANELQLCQRYFEKSYNVDTAPASLTFTSCVSVASQPTVTNASNLTGATYRITKRAAPVVSIYNPSTGAASSIRQAGTNYAVSVAFIGENGFSVLNNTGGAFPGSSATCATFHYTADAEL